jgi:ribosomal-protein-serine acetyltransferase
MEVVVRPWVEDDAPAMERAFAESQEHLRPWMAWAAGPAAGVAWRRRWIREQNEAEASGGDRVRGAFAADGTLVGAGGLHARLGPGALELGYWVHAAWTRRGVATAMVAALCDEAFGDEEVASVEIHTTSRTWRREGSRRAPGSRSSAIGRARRSRPPTPSASASGV